MAQRSEDGVGKTREESKRLERAKPRWTRSAISIQASGHVNSRIERPDTRKHLNLRTSASRKILLHPKGRSLIAPPPSSLICCRPARVMVLFAVDVSRRSIWSGPKRGCCKVHNGLAPSARPTPLATQSPAPSPEGDSDVRFGRTI